LDDKDALIGVVISKLEIHRNGPMRGYIAMLATQTEYRGAGIATELVRKTIDTMIAKDADEVSLHTPSALALLTTFSTGCARD